MEGKKKLFFCLLPLPFKAINLLSDITIPKIQVFLITNAKAATVWRDGKAAMVGDWPRFGPRTGTCAQQLALASPINHILTAESKLLVAKGGKRWQGGFL